MFVQLDIVEKKFRPADLCGPRLSQLIVAKEERLIVLLFALALALPNDPLHGLGEEARQPHVCSEVHPHERRGMLAGHLVAGQDLKFDGAHLPAMLGQGERSIPWRRCLRRVEQHPAGVQHGVWHRERWPVVEAVGVLLRLAAANELPLIRAVQAVESSEFGVG